MTFKEWKQWLAALPWSCKWFVLFILIRPVADNFYNLKEISPIYSPLYILGILTPLFIFLSFFSRKFPSRIPSPADTPVVILIVLILLNGAILLASDSSLDVIGEVLKSLTPFLLFLYLRHVVRSQRDLLGILQAFLYSCIFPGLVLLYENIFDPIAIEYVTEGRGGGSRIRGGYADVMTYAIFITGFFLVSAYYYLRRIYTGQLRNFSARRMVWVLAICLLGLVSIKQVSTWAVFLFLFSLFLLKSLRNSRGVILVMLIVLLILPFVAPKIYESQIDPLIQKEVAVSNGEMEFEYALNGRVGRWERYLAIWSDLPLLAKLTGVASSGAKEAPVMISGGIHNDFIRMMFLTGIAGLAVYSIFLFLVFRLSKGAAIPERFLVTGAVGCIFLHSLSALPLLYASYIYLLMSVFAYAVLPASEKNPRRVKNAHIAGKVPAPVNSWDVK